MYVNLAFFPAKPIRAGGGDYQAELKRPPGFLEIKAPVREATTKNVLLVRWGLVCGRYGHPAASSHRRLHSTNLAVRAVSPDWNIPISFLSAVPHHTCVLVALCVVAVALHLPGGAVNENRPMWSEPSTGRRRKPVAQSSPIATLMEVMRVVSRPTYLNLATTPSLRFFAPVM